MKTFITYFFAGAAFAFVAFLMLDYAASLPDVHMSYSTNECVSVLNYEGVFFSSENYSCENLPSKFNHVWVK